MLRQVAQETADSLGPGGSGVIAGTLAIISECRVRIVEGVGRRAGLVAVLRVLL